MEFLSGVAIGYVVVSVCESFFHRRIQHASATLRSIYRRLGWPGRALLRAWYAHHVVHHHLTFRASHVKQFSNTDERPRLDSFLVSKDRQHVIAESYGSRIGPRLRDYLLYVTPTLPIFATVCWAGGTDFTWGALIPFSVWPMLAQFVHPYIHMEYSQISAKAPLIIRAFSSTRYFRYLAIHHWLHHRYETCNYNLLLGGDIVLGVHRSATAADLAEMRVIGMWTPGRSQTQGFEQNEHGRAARGAEPRSGLCGHVMAGFCRRAEAVGQDRRDAGDRHRRPRRRRR